MTEDLLQNPKLLVSVSVRVLILFVGLFGNGLVVVAVWRKTSLRTATNLLLLNLAVSDLTTQIFATLMFIPEFTTLKEGFSSDFLCISFISSNIPFTTTFVSILTLTVLAVERYHAIVKPLYSGIRLQEDTVKYACLGVWLAGFTLALPFYIFSRYDKELGKCLYKGFLGFTSYKPFLAVMMVFLPFAIISFCYGQILRELYFKNKVEPAQNGIALQQETREKRKLFKLSLTITGVFVLFSFPLAICTGFSGNTGINSCTNLARIVFFSQAGFNPLIYSFQSSNFRQAFKEILHCRC